MKRYLTLAITAALMLSAFSCGSGGEGKDSSTSAPDSTGEETTAPKETDGLPEKDMDKFELKIVHFDGNWLSWALTKLDAIAVDKGLRVAFEGIVARENARAAQKDEIAKRL